MATDDRTGAEFTVARVYWVDRSLLELGKAVSESRAVRRIVSADHGSAGEAVARVPVPVTAWVSLAVQVSAIAEGG